MNYSAKPVAELRTLARGKLRCLNVKRNSAKRHVEEGDEERDMVCPCGEKRVLHAASVLPTSVAGVMKLKYVNMKMSWEQAGIIAKFSLLLFFLISGLGVNVLVKGSQLIRVMNWLTNPNPIQWKLYTVNTVCSLHDHIELIDFCHHLSNIELRPSNEGLVRTPG